MGLNNDFEISELTRKIANLIMIGEVFETDNDNKQFRFKSGALESNWIPYPCQIGRNFKAWKPLRLGQQIILACPGGDPAQAICIGEIYSSSFDSPSTNKDVDLIEFDNGNKIEHNSSTGKITVIAAGDVDIIGNENVTGDVFISGNLKVAGNADIEGNAQITKFLSASGMNMERNIENCRNGVLVCDDIEIRRTFYSEHTHSGVQSGESSTNKPNV